MKRRLFTLLSALSLLLCVAAAFPARLGAFRRAQSDDRRASVAAAAAVFAGLEERRANGQPLTFEFLDLEYTWSLRLAEAEQDAGGIFSDGRKAMERHLARLEELRRAGSDHTEYSTSIHPNMADYYVTQARLAVAQTSHPFAPAHPVPAAFAAILPILWLALRPWRWRPFAGTKGVCPQCGYDLRATPDRCPECGTVPVCAKVQA